MKRNKRNGLEQVVKKIVQASASGIAVAPAGIAVVSIAAEAVAVIRAGIAASRRNAFFQHSYGDVFTCKTPRALAQKSSSPYLSLISINSSLITLRQSSSLTRISSK